MRSKESKRIKKAWEEYYNYDPEARAAEKEMAEMFDRGLKEIEDQKKMLRESLMRGKIATHYNDIVQDLKKRGLVDDEQYRKLVLCKIKKNYHEIDEFVKKLESEKPKKKTVDKKNMISDIKSMLSDYKKSKKSQMIKDIDDLIKSVNETKPKMRKSLDKSIKANDLIHKIEGKLKKKKAIRMSLDKFF
jgi:hypothetical protein